MSKNILIRLRQYAVSQVLKTLPFRQVESTSFLAEPAARFAPPKPETDDWMFAPSRPVRAHMDELNLGMSQLSGALGSLQRVLDTIAEVAPREIAAAPALDTGIIWSDADLFDGEPQMVNDHVMSVEGHMDFLFENSCAVEGVDLSGVGQVGVSFQDNIAIAA